MKFEKEPKTSSKEVSQKELEKLMPLTTETEAELTLETREAIKGMTRRQLLETTKEAGKIVEATKGIPRSHSSLEYAESVETVKLIEKILHEEHSLLLRAGKITGWSDREIDDIQSADMMTEDEEQDFAHEERLKSFIDRMKRFVPEEK